MSKQYDLSLLAGAQGHLHDFLRSTQIGLEFFHGFRRLRNLGPTVTVFGSARFSEDHPSCVMARAVGAELAEYCLDVSFENHESGEPMAQVSYALVVPDPEDVDAIVLRQGDADAATLAALVSDRSSRGRFTAP